MISSQFEIRNLHVPFRINDDDDDVIFDVMSKFLCPRSSILSMLLLQSWSAPYINPLNIIAQSLFYILLPTCDQIGFALALKIIGLCVYECVYYEWTGCRCVRVCSVVKIENNFYFIFHWFVHYDLFENVCFYLKIG